MSGHRSVTELPNGQLIFGIVYTDATDGKPSRHAYEVAVATSDGQSFLMASRAKPSGALDVWVFDVKVSRDHGRLIGESMEVPADLNPFPAVGEPVYEDGPIAQKVHSAEALVDSERTGAELGATGRMADSPLQRVHRALAGSGIMRTFVPPAPAPPPAPTES